MSNPRPTPLCLLLCATLTLACGARADTVEGAIEDVSSKANTLRLEVGGRCHLVLFGPQTDFVNASGVKDLALPDRVRVEHTPGRPAERITRLVVPLPPGAEMSLEELEWLRGEDAPFLLVDARPREAYEQGHIPGAVGLTSEDLPKGLAQLAPDRNLPLVLYGDGPTCVHTGRLVDAALGAGYAEVKAFQGGIPAWRKAGKPVTSTPEWLAARLDPHHVVIDVRPAGEVAAGHIRGAVSLEAAAFPAMTRQFIAQKAVARLPGVSDLGAPIVVYGNGDEGEDVLTAFGELKKYRYRNATILGGGFREWMARGLPTAAGEAPTRISYTRKLKEGAVSREEFARLAANPGAVLFLDVRDDAEAAAGVLKGATHLPLDRLQANLASLPKDRPIVAYCTNGPRSEMAYHFLRKNGYEQVRYLCDSITVLSDGSYAFE